MKLLSAQHSDKENGLIPPYKGAPINEKVNIEVGNSKEFQFYNLKNNLGQQNNLATSSPEKLNDFSLLRRLEVKSILI